MTLAKMTGLLGQRYSNETASNPVVKVNDTDVTISDLSIEFGRNYKGQLASVVLFAIANEHGNVLKDGWKFVCKMAPVDSLNKVEHTLISKRLCLYFGQYHRFLR